MKELLEDIKNNTHQTKVLLEKSLELDVKPRNWHDSHTLTPTTEQRYNVFKNLGKQGGRYLRIKVSKACEISVSLAGVNQREKFEEGLKANRVGIFRFKVPMTLTDFYIEPSVASTVVTWWVSTVELPVDLEDDMTHLDGDTFESVSDRAVLIAGEDGTSIRTIQVDSAGKMKFASMDNNQNFGIRVGGFLPQSQQLGDAWYVKATGDDAEDGDTWDNAVLEIDYGFGLAGTNDYVFVANGSFNEDTNVTGVTCDTAGVHVVCQGGSSTQVENQNASATAVFTISASNVEVGLFRISETTNTVEGIVTSGTPTEVWIHHNNFVGTVENGIGIHGGSWILVERNILTVSIWNDAIELSGVSEDCIIAFNIIEGCNDIGISLNGNTVDGNFVYKNIINGNGDSTTTGISIILGDTNTIQENTIVECANVMLDTGSNNGWDNKFDQISGSFSRTVADGTGEDTGDIDDIDLPAPGLYHVTLEVAALDLVSEGGNIDCYLYKKVNPASYEEVDMDRFAQGADRVHMTVKATYKGGSDRLRASHTCSIAVTANRLMYFTIEHA